LISSASRPPTPLVSPTFEPNAPTAPSAPAAITPAPTDEDSVAVPVSPFMLEYDPVTRPALSSEVELLHDLTRRYLERFVRQEFSQTTMTTIDDFILTQTSSRYTMDAPFEMNFEGTGRINPLSMVFPSTAQLDSVVEIAFTGENLDAYETELMSLPQGNIFRGANVGFNADPATRVSRSTGTNAAAIAAGAIAATLLAAGFVLYRKRRQEEIVLAEKGQRKAPGDITLAGETFAGETHDETSTVDMISVDNGYRRKDEEDGMETMAHLQPITERIDDMPMLRGWRHDYMESGALRIRPGRSQYLHQKMSDSDESSESSVEEMDDEQGEVSALVKETLSYKEVALQGPAHNAETDEASKGNDEASQYSESEVSHFVENTDTTEGQEQIQSFLSYDSLDNGKSMSNFSDTTEQSSVLKIRSPRTVDEIEALLSADTDDSDGGGSLMDNIPSLGSESSSVTSRRPRTVEEIESLLSSGVLDGESVN